MPVSPSQTRTATLYRMVLPDHTCPFGVEALDLLNRNGYEVDDHRLTSRDQVDAFKKQHDIATTPLVFVGDQRIGGAGDLARWLERQR